jgi:integrase
MQAAPVAGAAPAVAGQDDTTGGSRWRDRYSNRHATKRLDPAQHPGTQFPSRVRIYARGNPIYSHILQWWSPQARKTQHLTLRGCDWVDALSKAREIDRSLDQVGRFEPPIRRRLQFVDLLDSYRAHLVRRADAGEITVATTRRYASDLDRFAAFVARSEVSARYPGPASIDEDFALEFMAYLKHPNDREEYVRGVMPCTVDATIERADAMLRWAADPRAGRLLPPGFINPFAGRPRPRHDRGPLLADPDITIKMAAEFLEACDDYALRLFAPVVLCGLRAAEPALMMYEHITDGKWLEVPNVPGLDYTTKGKISKVFPLLPLLEELLAPPAETAPKGLVFLRRNAKPGMTAAPLLGSSLQVLVDEYGRRRETHDPAGAAGLLRLRRRILREAGGLDYDDIYDEFRNVKDVLAWPEAATVKDFRHLFATTMENAGLTERYQKFFMGHSQGGDAIGCYRHINQLNDNFARLAEPYQPVLEVLAKRLSQSRSSGGGIRRMGLHTNATTS